MQEDEIGRHILEWLWILPTAVAGFGVRVLSDLSKSVKDISAAMNLLVFRIEEHDDSLDDHEERLRAIELKRTRLS